MFTAVRMLSIAALSAFVVAGCQMPKSVTAQPAPKLPAPTPAPTLAATPAACTVEFPKRHSQYALPPTVAPISSGSKGQPLQWAVSHSVGKAVTEIGTWRNLGNGWSSVGLRLTSANASGMAVRLSKVVMPDKAEIWLCSADGVTRRGPLRAGDGELYTPVVPGAEAWLEVLAPTRSVSRTALTLVEVYGGFR